MADDPSNNGRRSAIDSAPRVEPPQYIEVYEILPQWVLNKQNYILLCIILLDRNADLQEHGIIRKKRALKNARCGPEQTMRSSSKKWAKF
jgi:hypothetical protein